VPRRSEPRHRPAATPRSVLWPSHWHREADKQTIPYGITVRVYVTSVTMEPTLHYCARNNMFSFVL
jgi:hypothetical protein